MRVWVVLSARRCSPGPGLQPAGAAARGEAAVPTGHTKSLFMIYRLPLLLLILLQCCTVNPKGFPYKICCIRIWCADRIGVNSFASGDKAALFSGIFFTSVNQIIII